MIVAPRSKPNHSEWRSDLMAYLCLARGELELCAISGPCQWCRECKVSAPMRTFRPSSKT